MHALDHRGESEVERRSAEQRAKYELLAGAQPPTDRASPARARTTSSRTARALRDGKRVSPSRTTRGDGARVASSARGGGSVVGELSHERRLVGEPMVGDDPSVTESLDRHLRDLEGPTRGGETEEVAVVGAKPSRRAAALWHWRSRRVSV